jgi:hypothetical protein
MLDTTIANFFNENALPCGFAKLLISVLNSVINMLGANRKLQIDAKKVDSFLNQRMSILLPQHTASHRLTQPDCGGDSQRVVGDRHTAIEGYLRSDNAE